MASYYNDNYTALQLYLYGIYKYDIPSFYYMVGKYYFSIGKEKLAVKYFNNYAEKGGAKYLGSTYRYLSLCTITYNAHRRKLYNLKAKKMQCILNKLGNDNKDTNFYAYEGIENYERKEIKDFILEFDLYDEYAKLEIISKLYDEGYIKFADTLYNIYNKKITTILYTEVIRKKLENKRRYYLSQEKQVIL